MKITRLTKPDTAALKDLNALLMQQMHDPKEFVPMTMAGLRSMLADQKTVLLVGREGKKVIATGTLIVFTKIRGRYAYIEDTIVDGAERGKGYGEAIVRALIALARKLKVGTIELSTRPTRVAANNLYQKVGFVQKETNVYRLKL